MPVGMKFEIVDVDMSQVTKLSNDLRVIRSRLAPELRRATSLSAIHLRDTARRNWKAQSSGKRTAKYPATITHSMLVNNASITSAEVGPEKGGIGSLAHIFEFGSSKSHPRPHLVPAWLAEFDPYTNRLADAAEHSVLP